MGLLDEHFKWIQDKVNELSSKPRPKTTSTEIYPKSNAELKRRYLKEKKLAEAKDGKEIPKQTKNKGNYINDELERLAKYKSNAEAKEQLVDSHVNPAHYKDNIYGAEVWEQMVKLFGEVEYLSFCKLNAYKYRMRAGTKSGALAEVDIAKAIWYETKYKEIKDERPF
jgi:hypothetical protein